MNTELSKSLIVPVTDQYGDGISGLTVTFTTTAQGGTMLYDNAGNE